MRECAFCEYTGKLSLEHIFAQWIRGLFPGKKASFYIRGESHRNHRFKSENIDWKSRVVCVPCNTQWMSDIENVHGKPVLIPFITGNVEVPITQETAHSIALYAFKTAVVANHADRKLQPFFSANIRHAFRSAHTIPENVNIWICGIKNHRGDTQIKTVYYAGQISPTHHWKMYVFTCAIGNFVMQVVGVNSSRDIRFSPLAGFEGIGISMKPGDIPSTLTWPGHYVLDGSTHDFQGFADRWQKVLPLPSR